ncbi:paraquat-inducible protein A [Pedobacter sp. BMA]|uniref:paraquat-inducible protein A n=1 Tax=Pedobacter sp. BMA TaxID=1663685 RepID=UPI00064A7234|nr:paraquat-inducible protein A [Pedobacter sp. BMA]KLT63845.1 2-methylisocitrate lyase [Pedobacter sp. BMA]
MSAQIQQVSRTTKNISTAVLITFLLALLAIMVYLGMQQRVLSRQQEEIKEDYSLINNITFGIFSVDEWGEKIGNVVNHQVGNFNMNNDQKEVLQKEIEAQLNGLINKTTREITKPQKSLGGKLKKLAFNTFVDTDELHAQVPSFARTIIQKINSPGSMKRLKGIATSKMDELEKQTFDRSSSATTKVTRYILQKYKVNNVAGFEKSIKSRIAAIQVQLKNYFYAMAGCALIALLLWIPLRKYRWLHPSLFVLSALIALVLIWVGVSTTIIEVDARIERLDFMLLGEKITFMNQVLFFQSKSILGIVETLMAQPKPDAVIVGVLILLFVVVLPVIRLVGRAIYVWGRDRYADNKVIRYIALELGKWDMADVMVVGIAMTYIGLNGILKSQLSGLNMDTDTLKTITANKSSLQPGYYVFVTYVVFVIILSWILKRIDRDNKKLETVKN